MDLKKNLFQFKEFIKTKYKFAQLYSNQTSKFAERDFRSSIFKIKSDLSNDLYKDEFLYILRHGEVKKEFKSRYAEVFRIFQSKIDEFIGKYPAYCAYLPARIMYNCILLPIEAETQDTALRIFSTLNDRGLPLSDSDIFKAQFYKIFTAKGEKDLFIQKWKDLESLCEKIFHPISGTPMDELFTRYMYYERAKMGIKNSTTEALRKFYERNGYSLLKKVSIFDNLITLAYFWNDVANQNNERFSDEILRRLFVLNYAPNGMWTYLVSVYFMQKKDKDGMLDDAEFIAFLNRITAFIWTYAITNPGVNALRTPVYAEMVNIVNDLPVSFSEFRFDIATVRNMINNFGFFNARPITKAMLTWWAYTMSDQPLYTLETPLEIEHIYARNRNEKEHSLTEERSVELLGNKALLEKRINIRASDYRFIDKRSFYIGGINKRGQKKEGTKIIELLRMADNLSDFTEENILARNERIIEAFLDYLRFNDLVRR